MAILLQRSQYEKLYDLDADVAQLGYSLIYWLRYYGAVVRVSEGKRTTHRQRELYAQGRTAPGPIVTWTLQSVHLSGRAFDIDFVGYHPDAVHPTWWTFAGAIGEALGLKWGGRWSPPDSRHFEL